LESFVILRLFYILLVKGTLDRSVIRVLNEASFKFRESSRSARFVLDPKPGLVI